MFGWLSDKIDYLKPKYPSLWHTIYYGIRNHERGTVSIKRGNIKKIVWYACDPLKIYYYKKFYKVLKKIHKQYNYSQKTT